MDNPIQTDDLLVVPLFYIALFYSTLLYSTLLYFFFSVSVTRKLPPRPPVKICKINMQASDQQFTIVVGRWNPSSGGKG